MPKISVIIPTYNRAELLQSAITSVLKQTFQDFEIIVVDDASKDNTHAIVKSFDDRRLRYVRHEANRGEAGSRNSGVKESNGPYIAFLDDDDEWLPEKLDLQINLLENSAPQIGCVYTGTVSIDKKTGKILGVNTPSKRGNLFLELFINNCITMSSIMVRKICFETVGLFDERIPYGIDYDMWARIAKEFEYDYVREVLVKYYVHDDRLNNNLDLVIRGREAIFKKYDTFLALNRKAYSYQHRELGILNCLKGDNKKAREAYFRAIKLYPFSAKHYLMLALSFLGVDAMNTLLGIKERIVTPFRMSAP
jgi:glycosyltransferase involved in cell wall biosynthesis